MTSDAGADPARDLALLTEAKAAAFEAGRMLAENRAEWRHVTAEEGRDSKTLADRRAERVLLDRLSGLPVLSEESAWVGPRPAGAFWVIDPLDGTVNYRQGIPLWTVSVALVRFGRPAIGVVYDVRHDEMFSGIVGRGAFLNGERMTVSAAAARAKAVLATGLPLHQDFSPEAMNRFADGLRQWRKVRMLGTAALSLAYVAAGRIDAYREQGILPWDIAAGCALVEAAGGTSVIDGEIGDAPVTVFAHNGRLGAPDKAPS